ncbi:MAG: hypothetical protein ACSHX7_03215 [Luteolibacter sp.]
MIPAVQKPSALFIPDMKGNLGTLDGMLPETHPLIEAAVKPLADNAEQRLAAIALLEETFDENHPDVAETLERFHEVDEKSKPRLWELVVIGLAALAILFLGLMVIPKIQAFWFLRSAMNPLAMMDFEPPFPTPKDNLSEEQELLLGKPGQSRLQALEDLISFAPDRPDFYAEYVALSFSNQDELPIGYFETVERIDPENAFFYYLAAGVKGRGTVRKEGRSKRGSKVVKEQTYEIIDREGLNESLALLRKSRGLPRFDNYTSSMIAARIPLLKQDDVVQGMTATSNLVGGPLSIIRLRFLADMIAAEADCLVEEKDVAGLQELIHDSEHFIRVWSESPVGTLVDELVLLVCTNAITQSLSNAAVSLGIESQFSSLQENARRIEALNEEKRNRDQPVFADSMKLKGGTMAALSHPMVARQVRDTVPITEESLRPGRLSDHEVMSQVCAVVGSLVLLVGSGCLFLFRFRAPFYVRKTASRMVCLLTKADWMWVMSLGTAFPFLLILLANRFTPLGGRDYSLVYFTLILPGAHYLFLTISLLYAPVLVLRWRLKIRLRVFGLMGRNFKLGWLALALASSFIPAFYYFAVVTRDLSEVRLAILAALLLSLAVVVAISGGRAVFGKRDRRLTRSIVGSSLLPSFGLSIILLALLYPWFSASEKHWFRQDTLTRLDENYPGVSPYEYKVSAQLRKEVTEALVFPD